MFLFLIHTFYGLQRPNNCKRTHQRHFMAAMLPLNKERSLLKMAKNIDAFDEAMKFLEVLYGEEELDKGHLVCFTLPDQTTRWFHHMKKEEFIEHALDMAKTKNVYVGLGLQDKEMAMEIARQKNKNSSESRIRGYKQTVYAIPGVWLDIDVKGPAHKEKDLPDTDDDALKLIAKFPLDPTVLIHTGNGYQSYWLFKEPWYFDNGHERIEAQEFLNQFLLTMQYYASEHGWKLDSTSDLSRVFRIPGTWNRKNPNQIKPVKIVQLNEQNRYTKDEIEQYLLDPAHLPKGLTKRTFKAKAIPVANQFSKIEHIEQGCRWMKHCKEDAKTLSEPEWYGSLTILGRCLHGEKLAHEWSAPYENYTYEETQYKLAHALKNTGPITCEKVYEITNGKWCQECPFFQKVKSPIAISNLKEKENQLKGAKDLIMKKIQKLSNGDSSELSKTEKGALGFIKNEDSKTYQELSTQLNLALNESISKTKTSNKSSSKRGHIRIAKEGENLDYQTVETVLDNPPQKNLLIPQDYYLSENATFRVSPRIKNPQLIEIALAPILVTGLMKDIHTSNELIQLSWKRGGNWQKKIVSREQVANARKLVELAGVGFPVTSNNAKEIVPYIYELEALNYNRLPKQIVSSQLGWQGKKLEKGFLWGKHTIVEGEVKSIGMLVVLVLRNIPLLLSFQDVRGYM